MNTHETQPKRGRGEAGITLQEMLIAMVVSAIIAVPIASALFTSLRTTNMTIARTRQNVDANLLSTYFGTDVQSAAQVATAATESPAVCGGSATTVGLLMTSAAGTSSVSYGNSGANLVRRTCANGAVKTSQIVIRNLAPIAAPVTYSCLGATGNPDCSATGWRTLRIAVTQSNAQATGSYTSTVQAQRRVS